MIELWHLTNIHWLRELPAGEAEALRTAAQVELFAPDATIFEPAADPGSVFLLESGLVRLYRLGGGTELTLGYVRPGEIFGELTVFDAEAPRESFAQAVEPSSVMRLDRADFIRAIRANPSMLFEVATQIGGRFKRIEARVEDLVFRTARSRVAHILLELATDFGIERDGAIYLDVKLTHADLAKLVGATRPTVSIALGELEDEGLVSREQKCFLIQNPKALRELASRSE